MRMHSGLGRGKNDLQKIKTNNTPLNFAYLLVRIQNFIALGLCLCLWLPLFHPLVGDYFC